MQPIRIPESHNYVAVFLTLACNLRCSYCINRFDPEHFSPKGHLSAEEWIAGLNRIVSRPDLPLTLQGGEPTLHPGFYDIVNGVRPDLNIDVLTNLAFDVDEFMRRIRPERLKRNAPYASIRVSYHPETMELRPLAEKVLRLLKAGYSIGIWGVLHPTWEAEILRAQQECQDLGIDFRTKEFLGEHDGQMYGTIKYPGACDLAEPRRVLCRTTELLVGPTGAVHRCHSDLYAGRAAIGHINDPAFAIDNQFRPCDVFGLCNPCDVKVKTNRFQIFGHTSVEVRFPEAGT